MSVFDIQITNQQRSLAVDLSSLRAAIDCVLRDAEIDEAQVSLALVDNQQIHALNRKHLQHDNATDVLSFVFESNSSMVDGEIIVSAEMAAQVAEQLGVDPLHELLLYVVHGALHLVGCDDQDPIQQAEMVQRENEILAKLGLTAAPHRARPLSSAAQDGIADSERYP